MTNSFFERPILNSPYQPPRLHHALDAAGQPTDLPPTEGRRPSRFLTPVPKARRGSTRPRQEGLVFADEAGITTGEQEYNPTPIINEIRGHVAAWRELPAASGWGVTPATARLLAH